MTRFPTCACLAACVVLGSALPAPALAQSEPAAAPAATCASPAKGKRLFGFAARALAAAAPMIVAQADSPLQAAVGQVASDVLNAGAQAGASGSDGQAQALLGAMSGLNGRGGENVAAMAGLAMVQGVAAQAASAPATPKPAPAKAC